MPPLAANRVTLGELADLAIGTPEVGAVNFTALHTLIVAMLKSLNLQEVVIDFHYPSSVESSRSAESIRGSISTPQVSTSKEKRRSVTKQSSQQTLESQLKDLDSQVQDLTKQFKNMDNIVQGIATHVEHISTATDPFQEFPKTEEEMALLVPRLSPHISPRLSPHISPQTSLTKAVKISKSTEMLDKSEPTEGMPPETQPKPGKTQKGTSPAKSSSALQDLIEDVKVLKEAHQKVQESSELNVQELLQRVNELEKVVKDREEYLDQLNRRLNLAPGTEEITMVTWEELEQAIADGWKASRGSSDSSTATFGKRRMTLLASSDLPSGLLPKTFTADQALASAGGPEPMLASGGERPPERIVSRDQSRSSSVFRDPHSRAREPSQVTSETDRQRMRESVAPTGKRRDEQQPGPTPKVLPPVRDQHVGVPTSQDQVLPRPEEHRTEPFGMDQPPVLYPGPYPPAVIPLTIPQLGVLPPEMDDQGLVPLPMDQSGVLPPSVPDRGQQRLEKASTAQLATVPLTMYQQAVMVPRTDQHGMEQAVMYDSGVGPWDTNRQGLIPIGINQQGFVVLSTSQQGLITPGVDQQGLVIPGIDQRAFPPSLPDQYGLMSPALMQVSTDRQGFGQPSLVAPVFTQPGAEQRGLIQPEADQRGLVQPVVDQHGFVQPIVDQRGLVQPSVDQRGVVQPGIDQHGLVQPSVDQRGLVQPGVDQRGVVQPVVDQHGLVQPSVDQHGLVQPSVDQRGVVQPVVDQHGLVQPSVDQRGLVQPSVDQRGVVQPGVDQRGVVQPGVDQRGIVQPGVDQRGVVQPVVDQRGLVQPGVDQRGVVQPGVAQRGLVQPGVDQRGIVQPGVAQHGLVQPGVDQRGIVQPGVAQRGLVQPGVDQHGVVQPGIDQRGLVQPGVAQRGLVQPGIDQHGVVQSSVDQRGLVQPGVDQRGLVQPGVAQRGLVQPGVAQRGLVQPGVDQRGLVQPGVDQRGVVQPGIDQRGLVQPGVDQRGIVQPGIDQRGLVQPGIDQHGVVKPGVDQHGLMQPGVDPRGLVQPGAYAPGLMQPGTVQDSLVQPRMDQSGFVQPGADWSYAQPGVDQLDMAQPGAVQRGLVQPGTFPGGWMQPDTYSPGLVQPGIGQYGLVQPRVAQRGEDQRGLMQPVIDQLDWMQPGSVQPGAEESSLSQPGMGQQGLAQPGMDQQGLAQPGMDQQGLTQPRMYQYVFVGPGAVRPGLLQPRAAGLGMMQPGIVQPGAGPLGLVQPGAGPLGLFQPGAGPLGLVQPGAGHFGLVQPGAGLRGVVQPGVSSHGLVQPGVHVPSVAPLGASPPGFIQPGASPHDFSQPGVYPHVLRQPISSQSGFIAPSIELRGFPSDLYVTPEQARQGVFPATDRQGADHQGARIQYDPTALGYPSQEHTLDVSSQASWDPSRKPALVQFELATADQDTDSSTRVSLSYLHQVSSGSEVHSERRESLEKLAPSFPMAVETFRLMGEIVGLYTELKEHMKDLDEELTGQTELEKVQYLLSMMVKKTIPQDLQEQMKSLKTLAKEVRKDKDRLEKIQKLIDGEGPAGKEVKPSQLTLQLGILRVTVSDIEKELSELRESQERGKAAMENSVSEASLYLQDQLDKLRTIIESMLSSSSTLLSLSITPHKSTNTLVPGQLDPEATCPACSLDVGHQVSLLVQRYEQLQDMVSGLAASRPSKKAKLQSQDEELLGHVQSAILQVQGDCEKLNITTSNLIEDHRQKQKDIEVLYQGLERLEKEKADRDHLEMEIDVKADKSALASKVSRIQFDATTEQLNHMMQELVAKMSGQEQDWQKLLDKLLAEMDSKLDRLELDPVKQMLEDRWKSLRQQLKERSPLYQADEAAAMRRQLLAHFHCLSCDRPLETSVTGQVLSMTPIVPSMPGHRSIRPYTVFELEQVRQQSRNLKLGSSFARGDLSQMERSVGRLRSMHSKMLMDIEKVQIHFGGSVKASSQMIRELMHAQCLSHPCYKRGVDTADYTYSTVPRRCGGSHTLTYPYRRNRPQHLSPLEEIQIAMKHDEVDILGLDGHIYKGRMDTRLPGILGKDGMTKHKSKQLQQLQQLQQLHQLQQMQQLQQAQQAQHARPHVHRQPSLGNSGLPPSRPQSAQMLADSNSVPSGQKKDRPVSSEGRLSQPNVAHASIPTEMASLQGSPSGLNVHMDVPPREGMEEPTRGPRSTTAH
ncbi:glutamine-rich protein 2 [Arvicola amphibius]|uniref:glutamine-rich protein 2 n=1 Tax=Arvicola amphibius TaxID=1047088 RepID=UPI001C09898F|nr:glutamine-rich protein 2 [Arvicola amphibius]